MMERSRPCKQRSKSFVLTATPPSASSPASSPPIPTWLNRNSPRSRISEACCGRTKRFCRSIAATSADVDRKVQALRRALEPDVAAVGDIPPFDIVLAHELYTLLLQPVQAAWQPAKRLIVATNGALGLLPLGLLPTKRAEPDANVRPFFAGYRSVPWLARTHAVTLVPSVSA